MFFLSIEEKVSIGVYPIETNANDATISTKMGGYSLLESINFMDTAVQQRSALETNGITTHSRSTHSKSPVAVLLSVSVHTTR
jgi:hypothetical protein